MTYSLQLPNGQIADGIPDDVPRFKALAILRQQMPEAFQPAARRSDEDILNSAYAGYTAPPPPPAPVQRGVLASFGKGVEGAASNLATFGQSLFGDTKEASEAGVRRSEAIDRKYASEGDLEKIKAIYAEKGVGPALKEVARQFPHVVAENLPQILASIVGGVAGTVLTGGNPLGGMVGAGLVSGAMQSGSNLERQVQAQQEAGQAVDPSLGKAALAGTAQAALDVFALGKLGLGKFVGMPAKTAEAELMATASRSLKGTLARGAAGGATEIPTEIAQQVIERAQAGLPVANEEAFKEYQQAGYAAALLGPSIGGAMSPINRSSARDELERRQRAKDEKDTLDRIEAEKARKASPEYLNSLEGLEEQRKEVGKRIRELRGEIKRAQYDDEKAPLEAEHKALTEQIKALSDKIAVAKLSPDEYMLANAGEIPTTAVLGKDGRYHAPPRDEGAAGTQPNEFAPGVPIPPKRKGDKNDIPVNGEVNIDPNAFTPNYQTADAQDAFLLSLTNPVAYQGWLNRSQETRDQAFADSFQNPNPPSPTIDTSAPAFHGQQEQMWENSLAQQMGEGREQAEAAAKQRNALDLQVDRGLQLADQMTEVKRKVGMAARSPRVAQLLNLDKGKLLRGEYRDDEVLQTIERRIADIKHKQAGLAGEELYIPRNELLMGAEGQVQGIEPQPAMREAARNDRRIALLENLRQNYQDLANASRDEQQVTALLAGATQRGGPQPRPTPTGPTVPATDLGGVTHPIIRQSPDTTIPPRQAVDEKGNVVPAERFARIAEHEKSAEAQTRERQQLVQRLDAEREDTTALFVEKLIQLHNGEYYSPREVRVGEEPAPNTTNIGAVQGEQGTLELLHKNQTLEQVREEANGLARTVIDLAIRAGAEIHALNGGELPLMQAKVYGGRMMDVLRKFQKRAEANTSHLKFERNDAEPEDSEAYRAAQVRDTPFDNINAIDDALDAELKPMIDGLRSDMVGNVLKADAKKVQKGEKSVPMSRPTPETLAKEEQAARGTTPQQQRDYVYEKVRAALNGTLPPEVRTALERAERALREGFEGVTNLFDEERPSPWRSFDVPGEGPTWVKDELTPDVEPGSLSMYADRALSKVTPKLLSDIEQLVDTKDPQDARQVTDGLQLVEDVNRTDETQGDLFAGQDTPQVRILRPTPFLLRKLINSKHVANLKALLKPIEEVIAAHEAQMKTLNDFFTEEEFRLYDRVTNGGFTRWRQRVSEWNATLNDMRMLASNMNYVNEEAKRNNIEFVEKYIGAVHRRYAEALNKMATQINSEMDNAPKDGGNTETYHHLHQKLLELRYSVTRAEQKAMKEEKGKLERAQNEIDAKLTGFAEARDRNMPFQRLTEEQHKKNARAEHRNLRKREKGTTLGANPRSSLEAYDRVRVERELAAREREARKAQEKLLAAMKPAKDDSKAQLEEAKRNLNEKAPVGVRQTKSFEVTTLADKKQPGVMRTAVRKFIENLRDKFDADPNTLAGKMEARIKRTLDTVQSAVAQGWAQGEAEYDAMPKVQRANFGPWNAQARKVLNAYNRLLDAEGALTQMQMVEVQPVDQAVEGVGVGERNLKEKVQPARIPKQVPKKGTVNQIRALQKRVEAAELALLNEMDAFDEASKDVLSTLKKTAVYDAMRLSTDTKTATEKVKEALEVGTMPHGGRRGPQKVSPMNKTQHSLGVVRRSDVNKDKHPAEMKATRPGPRGETSPMTSSSAPYTKNMSGEIDIGDYGLDRDLDVPSVGAAMREAGLDDGILRTGATPGISPEAALAKAHEAARLFPSGGIFVYFPTPESIPPETLAKLPPGTKAEDVKGGMLPDGTMLLVGSTHADEADIDTTIAHEVIGHYKAERVMMGTRTGLQYMQALAAKHLSGPPKVAYDLMSGLGFPTEVVTRVATDSLNAKDPDLYVMREIVARASEMKPGSMTAAAKRVFQELWGAFKRVLRDHFNIDLGLSPADVFYMVKRAQEGEIVTKQGGEAALRTATAAPPLVESAVRTLYPPRKSLGKVIAVNGGLVGRTQYIDRWAPVKAVASRMMDALKATQMVYFVSMADRTNQMTAEAMTYGPVSLQEFQRKDGRIERMFQKQKGISVNDILKTLKGHDFKRWASWMALKRAQELPGGIRQLLGDNAPNLSPEQIQATLEYGDSIPAFKTAADQYKAYNTALVKLLLDTGSITQKAADDMLSRTYIPFYRVDPNGDVRIMGEHPVKIGNVRDQADLARIVGSDKPLDDPFANIATNTRILMKMALQNEAAKSVAFTLKELGLAEVVKANVRGRAEQGRNVIHFKYKGEDWTATVNMQADSKYADIPSDLLVKGMEGIATTLPDFLRVLQIPAKFLRDAITLMPTYMFRQLLRDPMHAWLSTGMDFGRAAGAMTRVFKLANHRDKTGELLRERGLVGGQVIQGNDEDMGRIMAQLHAGEGVLQGFFAKMHEYASASDAATRAALYDSYIAKGLSEMEATVATMESVNFATRGLSPSVHALNMVIPFFNAQIQGLDSVYRAMTGQMPFNEKMKARQKLIQRAMMVAAGTTLYYALVQDEDWYKNTPENVRLSNWLLKIPGVDEPIRIPIPFEFGFMFKAVPESIYMMSNGDKEADAAWTALYNMAANQIPGGSSFILPAGMKPMIETAANHSFFTGKPIVPGSLEKESASDQWTLNTTETAKALAGSVGASPMHFENLVRGYTGPAGYAVLQLIDAIIQPTTVPVPDKPLSRTAVVGPLFQQVDGPAVINRAYEQVKKIEAAADRFRRANEQGRVDDAMAVLQGEDANLIGYKSAAGRFTQEMGKLTKLERIIHFDPNLTSEQKAQQLKEIRALKIERARQFEQIAP